MRHIEKIRQVFTYLLNMTLLFGFTATIVLATGTIEKKSVFNVQSKLYVDGRLVSSPRIVTRANQKASIDFSEQKNKEFLKMELIARDEPKTDHTNSIKINFDIVYKLGNENMHSKPRLVVLPGQMAIVKFKTESGHIFELQVIAARV